MNKMCSTCVCDKVCDHNKYGFENCENYIDVGQIKWERDVAMEQLEKHGIPFCGMADVQAVVRCKDCRYYFHFGKTSLFVDGKNVKAGWCQRRMRYDEEYRMTPTDFCSYGERKVSE